MVANLKLWLRNSRALDYAGWKSDFDLTLWCQNIAPETISILAHWHSRLRQFFPILGEAAFITDRNIDLIIKHQNPLELRRDPVLLRSLRKRNLERCTPSTAQKFVYFARMLDADFANISTGNLDNRRKKWSFHFSELQISLPFSALNMKSLLEAAKPFLPLHQDEATAALEARRLGAEELSLGSFLLFTQRWNRHAHASGFIKNIKALPALTSEQKEIVYEQVRWELTNLSMQPAQNLEALKGHVRTLANLLEFTKDPRRNELIHEFSAYWGLDPEPLLSPLFASTVSPTFCILPWFRLHFDSDGSYLLCEHSQARFPGLNWNERDLSSLAAEPELLQLWRKMKEGELPPQCKSCSTPRLEANRFYDEEINRGLPLFEPRELVLSLGRDCERQCLSCNPGQSSRWAEFLKPQVEDPSYNWHSKPLFQNAAPGLLAQVQKITFSHCETLQDPTHPQLLQGLIESGKARDIALIYFTRGDVDLSEWFPRWETFKSVELRIDFEGVGARSDYLCAPSRFSDLESNLSKVQQSARRATNINLVFQIQLYCLNAYYLSECLAWLESQGTGFHPGLFVTSHPAPSGLSAIPPELKKALRERWLAPETSEGSLAKWVPRPVILQLLGKMEEADLSPLPMIRLLGKLDQLRNKKFADLFPEIAPYWKS
ncbi:MAG: hypothetical protein A2070_06170 [Bdellovibrionales bacterium GWC1_52_8]|nr:MAG: hypothetical protein A2Z97_03300 [Bdellovibrionales bacterium GWB1_52_6]OFZ02899.1 MAG: hypothetical protein A2X97_04825 [Bdellovibrionales bacterium GWA1_52_35]OFZ35836.1 MAG: hypothetical protein A2070_06170 [Bdellovibrionales bacterium GWC1_52_8]HCM38482.1 hypothetical protein [Bdellovibrionales bacterium]